MAATGTMMRYNRLAQPQSTSLVMRQFAHETQRKRASRSHTLVNGAGRSVSSSQGGLWDNPSTNKSLGSVTKSTLSVGWCEYHCDAAATFSMESFSLELLLSSNDIVFDSLSQQNHSLSNFILQSLGSLPSLGSIGSLESLPAFSEAAPSVPSQGSIMTMTSTGKSPDVTKVSEPFSRPSTSATASHSTEEMSDTGTTVKPKPKRKRKQRVDDEGPRDYVDEYTDQDVLFGRGGLSNNHIGNKAHQAYKTILQKRYMAASKYDKTAISEELVEWVKKRGGRFLKKDNIGWYQVSDRTARKKASQTLREHNTPETLAAKRAKYALKHATLSRVKWF